MSEVTTRSVQPHEERGLHLIDLSRKWSKVVVFRKDNITKKTKQSELVS